MVSTYSGVALTHFEPRLVNFKTNKAVVRMVVSEVERVRVVVVLGRFVHHKEAYERLRRLP